MNGDHFVWCPLEWFGLTLQSIVLADIQTKSTRGTYGSSDPEAQAELRQIHQQAYLTITRIDYELWLLENAYQSRVAPQHSRFTAATQSVLEGLNKVVTQFRQDNVAPHARELERQRHMLVPLCNGLAPIHRLPTCVLAKIFEYAVYSSTSPGPVIECAVPEWTLTISHVCRYWRIIAFGCPQLWSTVDLGRPALGAMNLNLGKDTLFIVAAASPFLDKVQHRAGNLLSAILSRHLHRVKHLLIPYNFVTMPEPTLPSGRLRSAANLKTLVLSDWKGSSAIEFLQCGFPSLEHLTVSPCHLPWSSLPLTSTLMYLNVRFPPRSSRPSIKSLVDSLRNLHNLRRLELANVLTDHQNPCTPDTVSGHLPLPSLRTLVLEDLASHISGLLEILRIPCEAEIFTHCDMGNPNREKQTAVIQRFIDSVYADPGTKLLPRRGVAFLRLSWEAIEVYHEPCNCNHPPNLTIYDSEGDLDYGEILDTLGNRADLSTLTHLVINDMLGLPDQSAWELLGSLPSVQTITLQQSSPMEFLDILYDTPDPDNEDSRLIHFPALQDVEFVDLCEDDYDVDVVELTSRIIQVFSRRAAAGYPIDTLEVQHSPCFLEEDIDKIRESVISLHVVWDAFEVD